MDQNNFEAEMLKERVKDINTMEKLQVERPSDTFDVPAGESRPVRRILMSAALIRTIASYINDIDSITLLYEEPELQKAILLEVLAERDNIGKLKNTNDTVFDYPLDIDHASAILEWVGEHLIYFFISNANSKLMLVQKNRKLMEKIQAATQLSNGSKA